MQRLNRDVFNRPDLVMGNLCALVSHVERRLAAEPSELDGRRWEIPRIVSTRDSDRLWVEQDGQFWRTITYIGAATTTDVIADCSHAREVGYGLGMFHNLISDLPVNELADTLENFHVPPAYLQHYDSTLNALNVSEKLELHSQPRLVAAMDFVELHRADVDVLEVALANAELSKRPIHGDPKINNVMIDDSTGQAVALIDLDTVKPGLVHYDIGDCLRSCCNPAGEEANDLDDVFFDLCLCEAILEGYFSVAGGFLEERDYRYLPECIRLIPFELGLRFLTDYLNGNIYFRTSRSLQNLDRAEVQFRLTQSIESQWDGIIEMIKRLTPTG